jgi:hypothetical protein
VDRHTEWLPPGTTAVLLLANPELEIEELERTIHELRASAVRPLVVAVDTLAFQPVDRPPTPVEVARERREALEKCLIDLDVCAAVLGPEEDPKDALQRPDFLERPPEVAR